ncbi:hypothetical protein EXE43_09640 [Halorubrum sp. SS5]|nr:hypothetical protein EXE43_09640 [Halorubrum sp. SS5]
MAQASNSSEKRSRITVGLSDRRKQEINRIAYDQSTPNSDVKPSEVVREAIQDYIEKYSEDPTTIDPRNRGCYGGEPLIEIEDNDNAETDEGAA